MFVLAGVLGILFLTVLGYTSSGSLLALVAAARRQRRARSVFRSLTRPR